MGKEKDGRGKRQGVMEQAKSDYRARKVSQASREPTM